MKDATGTMGTVLGDDVGGRDAVHVAVLAVRADEKLKPGQDVGLRFSTSGDYVAVTQITPIGIVDPFLDYAVEKGQRFWLFLYPRTITSLRHNWTHPAFPNEESDMRYTPPGQKLVSEQYLRQFCRENDAPAYEDLIKYAKRHDGTEWMHISGSDAHGKIPDKVWDHLEVILGERVPIEKRAKYFSYSC